MHKLVSRVARESAARVAALTATSGAVSTARGPAHARAPPQHAEAVSSSSSPSACQSEWLITQVDAGNVLFRPEDIDDVANEVLQLVPRHATQMVSQSETESEGHEASSIIEASDLSCSSYSNTASAGPYDVLVRVASELMKKPGVQQQVLDVILEDPELLKMLNDKSNMNNYLEAWGVSSAGLLPPATVIEEAVEESTEGAELHKRSPEETLAATLMAAFGKMGEAMQHVASWLGRLLAGPAPKSEGGSTPVRGPGNFFRAFEENRFLKSAILVAVGMVCVLLLRRPQMLAGLMRRKAVAAAAAAGVAAVAK